MAAYQGHRSRAAWNVALWIWNDEGLYRLALDCVARTQNLRRASAMMMLNLPARTPDGFRFTATSVREALGGINE